MYILSLLTPDKKVLDEIIDNILSQPKYRGLQSERVNWLQETLNKIKEMIEKLLSSNAEIESPQISSVPSSISTTLIIIGILLSIIFIVTIIILVKGTLRKERSIKTILGETIDEMTTEESLYDRVLQYENDNNYREAIRFGFIRLLFQMNEKNIIYLDESKTNSELIKALKNKRFSRIGEFEEIVLRFNEVWYGHKILDEKKYLEWKERITILWSEVNDFEGSK